MRLGARLQARPMANLPIDRQIPGSVAKPVRLAGSWCWPGG